MLNISLYGKKRIPLGVPTLLQMLQDKNRIMMPRANMNVVPMSVIKPNHVNECVNEEKKVINYNIGSEDPVAIKEECVIEISDESNKQIEIDVKKEDEEEVIKEEVIREEETHLEIQVKDNNNKKNKRGAKGVRDIRKKKK
jgi:hypothetical protein